MSNLMKSSIKEKLWHRMRSDLAHYVPEINDNRLLMCCCCGRFLPFEAFSLEHLIPQQAVKLDPPAVRNNRATPVNIRAGNLLLCQHPLKHKGRVVHPHGCNSWKGKYYDTALRELVTANAWKPNRTTQVHIIAALCLAYLAMVDEFGYRAVLMRSGLVMREQFFMPRNFHPSLPLMSQMILGGDIRDTPPDASVWGQPFRLKVEDGKCYASARNFAVVLPVSDDPHVPIPQQILLVPPRYKLRPDFSSFFH